MEKRIDTLKVYNLVNSSGEKLQLFFGRIKDHYIDNGCGRDTGFRWSFVGTNIPMPIRNGTWFNGLPVDIMMQWLNAHGWYVRSCANMYNGKVDVYELPDGLDENETYELSEHAIAMGEDALRVAIHELCNNGNKLRAIKLYRYVHPSSLVDAKTAVEAIIYK